MPKVRDWEELDDDSERDRPNFQKIHRGGHKPEDDIKYVGNKKQNKPKRIQRPDKGDFIEEPDEIE